MVGDITSVLELQNNVLLRIYVCGVAGMFFQIKTLYMTLYMNRLVSVSLLSLVCLFLSQNASAQTVVYQDDFEGAVSGWSSNTTENAPIIGTNFLGRFGGTSAQTTRTFTVPADATALDIEFDLLRFDSWDFFNSANQDGFAVLIDGNPIFSTTSNFGTFPRLSFGLGQGPRSGTSGNVDWAHVRLNPTDAQVNSGNQEQELGFTSGQFWFDQIHRFTINVNNPGNSVDVTLRFDSDQDINDESVGFDNFLVTAMTPFIPTDVDLVTTKTLISATATPSEGGIVTFQIDVTNNGGADATGVTLTDLLPAGLTATAANGAVTAGTYDAASGLWTLGALADGASATLTIEGTVDAGQVGNIIANTLAAPASGDQTDPTTQGDDLTESVTPMIPVIDAVDNDFTAASFVPGIDNTTPSIFENDTLNGAAFAPSSVTARITDNGSLFGAVINPDGTIDIPAAIAPGIYQLVYELCDVNDASNCDTALVMLAVQGATTNTFNRPGVCGEYLSQSWITHGKLNLHDSEVRFRSGDFATDPYVYLPIERDADGRILTYFGENAVVDSGTILTIAGLNLVSTSNNLSNHESDFHVIVYKLEGAPGSTLTASLNTRAGQEHTAYWIEDTAGNVTNASDFEFTTSTPNIGGVGEALPLSFTAPADGVSYLNVAIFDPSVAFGRPVISDYECPAPSLTMTKLADSEGPYVAGEVVTYTYTVTNNGNQNVNDVAIADTHNGSDPAPIPSNETLLTDVAPSGDSTDATNDNSWDVLAPGDAITFTGAYTITEIDAATLGQ